MPGLGACFLIGAQALLQFEKGKTGTIAGSMERLPAVIDTLIEAGRAGELDLLLDHQPLVVYCAGPARSHNEVHTLSR